MAKYTINKDDQPDAKELQETVRKLREDLDKLTKNTTEHKDSTIIDHKYGSIGLRALDTQVRAIVEKEIVLYPYAKYAP